MYQQLAKSNGALYIIRYARTTTKAAQLALEAVTKTHPLTSVTARYNYC
jgi:hypothetical protein